MGPMNGAAPHLYILLDYVRVHGKTTFLIVMLLSFGLLYFEENGAMYSKMLIFKTWQKYIPLTTSI